MLKKMGYALVCTAALMSTSSYSATAKLMGSMPTKWHIPAHSSLTITNEWFDPLIEGTCDITMENGQSADLVATVKVAEVKMGPDKDHSNVVNVDEPLYQTVRYGSSFFLSATLDASVILENLSDYDVDAWCSVD